MNAKQYLKQAYRLDELIKSNEEELANLRLQASSAGSIDYSKERVQTSPSQDAPFVHAVMKIIELEKAIQKDIDKLYSLKLEIRTAINQVSDQDEKLLLRCRYLNFMQWEDIATEMNFSLRTIHRIHHNALDHFVVPI